MVLATLSGWVALVAFTPGRFPLSTRCGRRAAAPRRADSHALSFADRRHQPEPARARAGAGNSGASKLSRSLFRNTAYFRRTAQPSTYPRARSWPWDFIPSRRRLAPARPPRGIPYRTYQLL